MIKPEVVVGVVKAVNRPMQQIEVLVLLRLGGIGDGLKERRDVLSSCIDDGLLTLDPQTLLVSVPR